MVRRERPGTAAVRPGHSLPELLVALVFLGATLTAMASAAVVGARWTADAVLTQRALGVAQATLDSLTGLVEPPGPEGALTPPWAVDWTVDSLGDSGGRAIRVTVRGAAHPMPPVGLDGIWTPPVPPLP